jgi:hypothetical protein
MYEFMRTLVTAIVVAIFGTLALATGSSPHLGG